MMQTHIIVNWKTLYGKMENMLQDCLVSMGINRHMAGMVIDDANRIYADFGLYYQLVNIQADHSSNPLIYLRPIFISV